MYDQATTTVTVNGWIKALQVLRVGERSSISEFEARVVSVSGLVGWLVGLVGRVKRKEEYVGGLIAGARVCGGLMTNY